MALTPKFANGQRYYEDLMGNKYQYDLTNSMDKQKYSMDFAAQQRDKLSVNPTRDRNGGGILDK